MMKQTLYSQIANTVLFPVLDSVRGISISKQMRFLEESQWWSRTQMQAYQGQQLHALMTHAYANVPYYRRVMQERALTPADFTTLTDLNKLPILTKDIIRANFDDLIATNADRSKLQMSTTGGSTGEPMRFYRDNPTIAMQQAAFWRGLAWAGLHRGERMLMLTGGSLGTAPVTLTERAKEFVARQYSFEAFQIMQANLPSILKMIRRIRPKAIKGYVSVLLALSDLIAKSGEQIHIPIVFTTSEKLWPEYAEKLATVFGGKVIDYYGSGEVNSIAYQIEQGGPLLISDEKVIMETAPIPEGAPAGVGRFLLTDITNYAFPFIRYENGDAGILSEAPDSDPRGLSRIQSLEGRMHDFIMTTSGDPMTGMFFTHLFKFVKGVDYFQIVQDAPDHLLVNVITNEVWNSENEAFTRGKMQEYLGSDMRIDFNPVAELPRTRNGKLRVTMSLLNQHAS